MIEADFQDELIVSLRRLHCYCKPLVANTLMAGLPDMLVINRHGFLFHIENKVWTKQFQPTSKEDFYDLLKGPQKNVIPTYFHGRKVFCPIVAFCKYQPEWCWYFDGGETIQKIQWEFLARYFADLEKQ